MAGCCGPGKLPWMSSLLGSRQLRSRYIRVSSRLKWSSPNVAVVESIAVVLQSYRRTVVGAVTGLANEHGVAQDLGMILNQNAVVQYGNVGWFC